MKLRIAVLLLVALLTTASVMADDLPTPIHRQATGLLSELPTPIHRPMPAILLPVAPPIPQPTEKPLCVLVGATWCQPCQAMDDEILPAVSKAVLSRVNFFKADVDKRPDWKDRLSSGQVPELILIEHGHWHYLTGYKKVAEVEKFIREWSGP